MNDTPTTEAAAKPTWRRRLTRIIVRWGAFYLGVLAVLMLLENRLVFHPARAESSWVPPPANCVVGDVWLDLADGTRLHAWWFPQPGATGALLYCHGNAGNLSYRGQAAQALAETLGVSVLLFDYPGYGKSEGKPSEAACYAAADAAYDWLVEQQKIPAEQIILYGKSLGGGVAADLAVRRPHRALLLLKTFTSIPDMAWKQFPFIPTRWLVRNRFDTLSKIGRCTRPVVIAHGDRDGLIPLWMAEANYQAAPTPKQFFLLPGAGHNDMLAPSFLRELRAYLDQAAPSAVTR